MARRTVDSIEVNADWCKRCGICVAMCPKSVFDADQDGNVLVSRIEDCISCELCERICPDLAIELVWQQPPQSQKNADQPLRDRTQSAEEPAHG